MAGKFSDPAIQGNPVPWVAAVLALLGLLMLIEAVVILIAPRPPRKESLVPAAA